MQELERHPRVRLVNYEELVQDPRRWVEEIYGELGLDFVPEYASHINARSVGKRPFPEINPEVEALCDELLRRLQAAASEPHPLSQSTEAEA